MLFKYFYSLIYFQHYTAKDFIILIYITIKLDMNNIYITNQ